MADPVTWQSAALAVGLAAISAAVAWRAAILARRSAFEARISQEESVRLQRLDARVSAQKYEVYSPLITLLGSILTPGVEPSNDDLLAAMTKFQTWAGVYASDEALRAFGRMMQGTFKSAPARIMLRLYADFVIEARKDMGDESTKATIADVLAPRIKDLYTDDDMAGLLMPFDELCRREGWAPPWSMVRA